MRVINPGSRVIVETGENTFKFGTALIVTNSHIEVVLDDEKPRADYWGCDRVRPLVEEAQ
jgi:hypothetical protein